MGWLLSATVHLEKLEAFALDDPGTLGSERGSIYPHDHALVYDSEWVDSEGAWRMGGGHLAPNKSGVA
jgi:hypothetical protein